MEITWDETDHERITTLNRKFKKEELLDMDFQAYLASSSEDEEEIEEEQKGTVNLWCSTFVSIQIPKLDLLLEICLWQ